jgi:hypothetical protein
MRETAYRNPAVGRLFSGSMIFSESRYPSRIKSGTGIFGIMLDLEGLH